MPEERWRKYLGGWFYAVFVTLLLLFIAPQFIRLDEGITFISPFTPLYLVALTIIGIYAILFPVGIAISRLVEN